MLRNNYEDIKSNDFEIHVSKNEITSKYDTISITGLDFSKFQRDAFDIFPSYEMKEDLTDVDVVINVDSMIPGKILSVVYFKLLDIGFKNQIFKMNNSEYSIHPNKDNCISSVDWLLKHRSEYLNFWVEYDKDTVIVSAFNGSLPRIHYSKLDSILPINLAKIDERKKSKPDKNIITIAINSDVKIYKVFKTVSLLGKSFSCISFAKTY